NRRNLPTAFSFPSAFTAPAAPVVARALQPLEVLLGRRADAVAADRRPETHAAASPEPRTQPANSDGSASSTRSTSACSFTGGTRPLRASGPTSLERLV